jgi:hypothetical protein
VVHKDNDVKNNYYKNLDEVNIAELLESKNPNKSDDTSSLTNRKPVKVEKPVKPARAAKPPKLKRRRKTRKPMGKLDAGVLQFSREGKFVREFLSIHEAARDLKINPKLILACLKGNSKIAAGNQWLYREDPNFDDGIFDINPVPKSGNRSVKPICQYDREGKFIREFPSVKEAAKAMDMTPGAISFSMQKPNRTAGGYRWKLREK